MWAGGLGKDFNSFVFMIGKLTLCAFRVRVDECEWKRSAQIKWFANGIHDRTPRAIYLFEDIKKEYKHARIRYFLIFIC